MPRYLETAVTLAIIGMNLFGICVGVQIGRYLWNRDSK